MKDEKDMTSEEKSVLAKVKAHISENALELLKGYATGSALEAIGSKEFSCYSICGKTRSGVTEPEPSAPRCLPEEKSVATGYKNIIYDNSYGCAISQPVAGDENPLNGVDGAFEIQIRPPAGNAVSVPLTLTNGQINADIDMRDAFGSGFVEGRYEVTIGLSQK